ncbi:MAG: hypothetical protein AAF985_01300, partial [Bacteroidota bacterium]
LPNISENTLKTFNNFSFNLELFNSNFNPYTANKQLITPNTQFKIPSILELYANFVFRKANYRS